MSGVANMVRYKFKLICKFTLIFKIVRSFFLKGKLNKQKIPQKKTNIFWILFQGLGLKRFKKQMQLNKSAYL